MYRYRQILRFLTKLIDILYRFPIAILAMWGPLFLDFGSGLIVVTWVTTVLITLYSTWLAKTLDLIGTLYVVQGIIILVPGSRILIGASESLFGESFLSTTSIGMSAVYIFSVIVAGQITVYSTYSQKIEH